MERAIATRKKLEKEKKTNQDMKSVSVNGLLVFCSETIWLCEEINKLKSQLDMVKKMLK